MMTTMQDHITLPVPFVPWVPECVVAGRVAVHWCGRWCSCLHAAVCSPWSGCDSSASPAPLWRCSALPPCSSAPSGSGPSPVCVRGHRLSYQEDGRWRWQGAGGIRRSLQDWGHEGEEVKMIRWCVGGLQDWRDEDEEVRVVRWHAGAVLSMSVGTFSRAVFLRSAGVLWLLVFCCYACRWAVRWFIIELWDYLINISTFEQL